MVNSTVLGWKVLDSITGGWNIRGCHDPLFFHSLWGTGDHQVSRRVASFLQTTASVGQPSKGIRYMTPPPPGGGTGGLGVGEWVEGWVGGWVGHLQPPPSPRVPKQ